VKFKFRERDIVKHRQNGFLYRVMQARYYINVTTDEGGIVKYYELERDGKSALWFHEDMLTLHEPYHNGVEIFTLCL
jgi:hypothetical protein